MSLVGTDIPIAPVLDTDVNLGKKVSYLALVGPSVVNTNTFEAVSHSASMSQFTANPPSPHVVVDRHVQLSASVTLTFSATAPTACVLQSAYDALRAMPLHSCMENLQVRIDDTVVNFRADELVHEYMRIGGSDESRSFMSMSPTFPDQSQAYSEMVGTVMNPLAAANDSTGRIRYRGAHPVSAVTNVSGSGTASITFNVTENLMVSPLLWSSMEGKGLIHCQNFSVTINWSNLERLWCHTDAAGVAAFTITSAAINSKPSLTFRYKTPSSMIPIPKAVFYKADRPDIYIKDSGTSIAAQATGNIISDSISLSAVPSHFIIMVKRPRSNRSALTTDAWFGIERVNRFEFNNANHLVGVSKERLYAMSRANGVDMTWPEWSGEPSYFSSGSTGKYYSGIGSVLVVRCGKDIGLGAQLLAPGSPGNFQVSLDVQVKNMHLTEAITPSLYIVPVYPGIMKLEGNVAAQYYQTLSQEDVLSATKYLGSTNDPQDSSADAGAAGGSILGDIKRGFEKAVPIARKVREGLQGIANLAAANPATMEYGLPAKTALDTLQAIGLGKGGSQLIGGKKKAAKKPTKKGGRPLTEAQLRKLMMA